MSFDFLYRSVGPFGVFLLGCLILALGVFIGGLARRRHAGRNRKAEPVQVLPSVHDTGVDAGAAAAAAEPLYDTRPAMPREWDGGRPKPNWNRRSG